MNDYTPGHRGDVPEQEPVFGEGPPAANTLLSNKLYDRLKFLAQVLMPGVAALYFGLAAIWGLPKAEEIVGTITVLDTFLGLFLVAGARQYQNSDARFDGAIRVENFEAEGYSNLNVRLDPDAIADKDEVTVKVKRV